MNKNALIAVLSTLALVVVAAFLIRNAILGNMHLVKLPSAPPMGGLVSQSLGPVSGGGLPVPGQDYNFDTKYFDNNDWAVVSIKPISSSLNGGILVMQKINGYYQAVLGPGAVTYNQLSNLPTDVAEYLASNSAVYQPTAE